MVVAGISIGMGLSFFLLYTRMKDWNTDMFRWTVTGVCFIIGLTGLVTTEFKTGNEQLVLFGGMTVPFIYNSFDRLFKQISKKYQNRDFYLYLRHSHDINEYPLDNPHVSTMDIVFSFGLLIIIILATSFPVTILKWKAV